MYVRIGAVALLILLTGSIVLGTEVFFGVIKGHSLRVISILMTVATFTLLFEPNTIQGLVSGYGPFDSEPLTFDTKFEDVHINGRISGNVAIA